MRKKTHPVIRTRAALLQTLLRAARSMVQGGMSETFRRCGKATCACATDPAALHGPHLYLTYREDGASRSLYVPPEHAEAARTAHAAWTTFWETAGVLAASNRDRLRRPWRRRSATLARRGHTRHD